MDKVSDQHQRIDQRIYLPATDMYMYIVQHGIYNFHEKATKNSEITPMPHYHHIQDWTCQHAHIAIGPTFQMGPINKYLWACWEVIVWVSGHCNKAGANVPINRVLLFGQRQWQKRHSSIKKSLTAMCVGTAFSQNGGQLLVSLAQCGHTVSHVTLWSI